MNYFLSQSQFWTLQLYFWSLCKTVQLPTALLMHQPIIAETEAVTEIMLKLLKARLYLSFWKTVT